ncbi:MAG TPA: FliH/SctL family protein [Candidatus Sulfotelmatobacter sp.]|jgi:flagellar assembly protein FliH|nr:FliH/SctL family protein [Candidatus Sulfotelmatobacter sp.]
MKWADTILFDRTLGDVRQLTGITVLDWQDFQRERDAAAYERGRRDGESALNEQLIRQRNEMVQLQRGIFESLQKVLPQVIHESENSLIELTLETAKKIVAGIAIDSALVEAAVRDALRQCEGASEILVQLHPDDLALLRQNQSPILEGLPETGPLKFSGSAEVTRGGCILQTRFGLVDARRETKIHQITQSLNA